MAQHFYSYVYIVPKELKAETWADIYTPMCIVALFTVATM